MQAITSAVRFASVTSSPTPPPVDDSACPSAAAPPTSPNSTDTPGYLMPPGRQYESPTEIVNHEDGNYAWGWYTGGYGGT